jgi:hypothetical protein
VQVKTMRNLKALDVQDIHRMNHGVHGKLIIEILIEFAIGALIVMGAGAKFNVADHVMQTGLFPGRVFAQFVLPEDNSAALAFWDPAVFANLLIFRSRATQGPVVGADRAPVFQPTKLVRYDTRLHPDTGGVAD